MGNRVSQEFSKSCIFFTVILQLFGPPDLLLNLLETLEEEHVKVWVDADPSVGLAGSPVLEHEAHALLLQLEGGDGVPTEFDHLILDWTVLSTGLQPDKSISVTWRNI